MLSFILGVLVTLLILVIERRTRPDSTLPSTWEEATEWVMGDWDIDAE